MSTSNDPEFDERSAPHEARYITARTTPTMQTAIRHLITAADAMDAASQAVEAVTPDDAAADDGYGLADVSELIDAVMCELTSAFDAFGLAYHCGCHRVEWIAPDGMSPAKEAGAREHLDALARHLHTDTSSDDEYSEQDAIYKRLAESAAAFGLVESEMLFGPPPPDAAYAIAVSVVNELWPPEEDDDSELKTEFIEELTERLEKLPRITPTAVQEAIGQLTVVSPDGQRAAAIPPRFTDEQLAEWLKES